MTPTAHQFAVAAAIVKYNDTASAEGNYTDCIEAACKAYLQALLDDAGV